jgi:hypothetical protein
MVVSHTPLLTSRHFFSSLVSAGYSPPLARVNYTEEGGVLGDAMRGRNVREETYLKDTMRRRRR